MITGHNLWDFSVWSLMVSLAILFFVMLLANVLRQLIKPLRQTLVPAPVLGGFILLFAGFIYKLITGEHLIDSNILEIITYHGLGLGFVAISLKNMDKIVNKNAQRDIFNTSLVTVSSYLLQGMVGLIISFGLSYLIACWPASGMLLPMGYGQGPGQAYTWGHTYETQWNFTDGTSFGLTVAAMGFIAASIGGVIYLNVLKRKGKISDITGDEGEDKRLSAAMVTGENEIPLTGSMDKLTAQFALVFLAYALACALLFGIGKLCDMAGGFFVGTVKPLLFGFNFIFGTLMGIIIKKIFGGLYNKKILPKQYLNNFMLDRVSGFMFDLMVVAAIGAINLSAFKNGEFVLPLALMSLAGGFITYFFNRRVAHDLFPEYGDEAFLAMFGMNTGTASTGVILLREIDPEYKTPACNNIVYQALWAIVLGFPMLLLMGMVAKSTLWTVITLAVLSVMFTVFFFWIKRNARVRREKSAAPKKGK